jgi:adenosylcobinamide kinase / adenosylcobinamide-phosphate guanylyltransferase
VTEGRVLVLGGSRSGKSAHAEALLRDAPAVDYIATASRDAADPEWAERIARHRRRRPASWHTVETTDLHATLAIPSPPALIDSITAWLASAMDTAGVWTSEPGALDRLHDRIDQTVASWARTGRPVVAVSDEVGSGIVPESMAGRLFRDELGLLNQRLAATADQVWLVTAGIPVQLR